MTHKKGIDVSSHQGKIDWESVKENINFVIIRAGYGKNNIDKYFERNAKECRRLNIPFGLYWFSYALNEQMAIDEANYCCDLADKFSPSYPVCFDYEYDSYNYAKSKGVAPSKSQLQSIASAFLNRVEERGYYAMNYTNIDYLNKGFSELTNKYDTWLAQWNVNTPSKACGIWQYSSKGKVNGISGNVDLNIAYTDFPLIISQLNKKNGKQEKERESQLNNVKEEFWKTYCDIAYEVINGEWGNGETRKQMLTKEGYDYRLVQSIVNVLIGER